MKKLSLVITAVIFSFSLMAQPYPPSFLGVYVTGSEQAISQQLEYIGFTKSYDKSQPYAGVYKGEEAIIKLKMNEDIGQVCEFTVNIDASNKVSADEVIKKYAKFYNEFRKDPDYKADPSNKMPSSAADFDPNRKWGVAYTSKFYQGGDVNRLLELGIWKLGDLYMVQISVKNLYNR